MTVHWRSLDKVGKVAAVKAVYQPGMRAKDIAACFDGVTRNAILGLYTRCREELVNCRLPRREKRVLEEGPPRRVFRGVRVKEIEQAEHMHGCGKPVALLDAEQCRWPVNDAEVGDLHLFCGMPSAGTYCEHHSSKAYRRAECS